MSTEYDRIVVACFGVSEYGKWRIAEGFEKVANLPGMEESMDRIIRLFDSDRTEVFKSKPQLEVSQTRIVEVVRELAGYVKELGGRVGVVVYLFGHGRVEEDVDPNYPLFMASPQGNVGKAETDDLGLKWLRERATTLLKAAHHTLFLVDCCHAGAVAAMGAEAMGAEAMGATHPSPVGQPLPPQVVEGAMKHSVAQLAYAAGAKEKAYTSDEGSHFTQALEATVARFGGQVTLSRVIQEIHDVTPITNLRPNHMRVKGEGDFVFPADSRGDAKSDVGTSKDVSQTPAPPKPPAVVPVSSQEDAEETGSPQIEDSGIRRVDGDGDFPVAARDDAKSTAGRSEDVSQTSAQPELPAVVPVSSQENWEETGSPQIDDSGIRRVNVEGDIPVAAVGDANSGTGNGKDGLQTSAPPKPPAVVPASSREKSEGTNSQIEDSGVRYEPNADGAFSGVWDKLQGIPMMLTVVALALVGALTIVGVATVMWGSGQNQTLILGLIVALVLDVLAAAVIGIVIELPSTRSNPEALSAIADSAKLLTTIVATNSATDGAVGRLLNDHNGELVDQMTDVRDRLSAALERGPA